MSRYPESTSPRLPHDPDELSRRCTTILTSRTPTAEQMARVQAILGESSRYHTIPEGALHDAMAPRQAVQPQHAPLRPPSPSQSPHNPRPRRMADQGLPSAIHRQYDRYESDGEEQHRPKRQRTEREYSPDRRYEDAATLRMNDNPGRSKDGSTNRVDADRQDPRRHSPVFTNADHSTSRSTIASAYPHRDRPDPIRNDLRDRATSRSHHDDETFDGSVELGRGTAARRPSSVQSERFGHHRNVSLGPSGFGDDEPLRGISVGFELDGRTDSHRDARKELKTGTAGGVGDGVGADAAVGASSRAGAEAGAGSSTAVGKKPEAAQKVIDSPDSVLRTGTSRCKNCRRAKGKECWAIPNGTRCAPCVRSSIKCSLVGSTGQASDEEGDNRMHQLVCNLSGHSSLLTTLLKSVPDINPILKTALESMATDLNKDRDRLRELELEMQERDD